MTRLRHAAIVGPLALIWILAACSATEPPASSSSTSPSDATDATDAADPVSDDLTPEDFAPRLVAAYEEAGSVRLTMSIDAGGESVRAEGSMVLGEDSSDLAMVTEIPGAGSVEMLYVDGIAYMNLGEASGDGFLRIDPADTSNPMAPMVAELEAQADPTQSVRDLDGAIVSIARTGSEEVDGVPTTAYDVVVDTTKVTGAMAEQVAQGGDLIPDRITYQYWVDADDRMRRVSFEMAGGSTTLQMTGWGEVGAIEAPAESELVDPAELGL